METKNIGIAAADKALRSWLQDMPWRQLDGLDRDDLADAAHYLVNMMGMLLARTYGGQREAALHFDYSVFYDDAPLTRAAAEYLASRRGWFCTTVVETDGGGYDVTLRLDGTYTDRADAERAADLVDVMLAAALDGNR